MAPRTLRAANANDTVRKRDRSSLNAEVQSGNDSTGWCNLANIAFQAAGEFDADPATAVDFKEWHDLLGEQRDVANKLLKRQYRKGYDVPSMV